MPMFIPIGPIPMPPPMPIAGNDAEGPLKCCCCSTGASGLMMGLFCARTFVCSTAPDEQFMDRNSMPRGTSLHCSIVEMPSFPHKYRTAPIDKAVSAVSVQAFNRTSRADAICCQQITMDCRCVGPLPAIGRTGGVFLPDVLADRAGAAMVSLGPEGCAAVTTHALPWMSCLRRHFCIVT